MTTHRAAGHPAPWTQGSGPATGGLGGPVHPLDQAHAVWAFP